MDHPSSAPQEEIHLPLHEPVEEPAAPVRPRIPNWVLALGSLALVLVAFLTWFPPKGPEAEEAVRAYLEDVHSGDVDAALARVTDSNILGAFTVPEALDSSWEITEVAQVSYRSGGDGRDTAEVYAEIEAYDGTGLGYHYEVAFYEGEPRIVNGLADSARFSSSGSAELNGVMASVGNFNLLPGVYRFYESAPATLEMNMPPVIVLGDRFIQLGGDHSSYDLRTPIPRFTEEGEAALANALKEFLDACAIVRGAGCPFELAADDTRLREADEGEPWRILEYPQATFEGWYVPDGMRLSTTVPGVAEFDATVVEADGKTRETEVNCPILVEGLLVYVDYETGAVEIRADGRVVDIDPETGDVTSRPGPGFSTSCRWPAESE